MQLKTEPPNARDFSGGCPIVSPACAGTTEIAPGYGNHGRKIRLLQ